MCTLQPPGEHGAMGKIQFAFLENLHDLCKAEVELNNS